MESYEHTQETTTYSNGRIDIDESDSFESEPEVGRLQKELASERERYLRMLAEFDNYRRRTRLEHADAENAGKHELLLRALEVMDDFERALEHVKGSSEPVAEGLRIIYQRFQTLLQGNGVTPFESKGRPFDPMMHEAMSVVETDADEPATIYEEVLRGYEWNGALLRPARVIVVR